MNQISKFHLVTDMVNTHHVAAPENLEIVARAIQRRTPL